MAGNAAAQVNRDSLQQARQHSLDSSRQARLAFADSLKQSREHILDSIKLVRKNFTDSLNLAREYRNSNHYKDSVTSVRENRLDSIRTAQKDRSDSMRLARQAILDSTMAVRQAYTDSLRAITQARTDSLMAIREYRNSQRYKDSVSITRKIAMDSIRAERKAFADSSIAARKAITEAAIATRKASLDSLKAIRVATTDSLKAIRKARTDSLATIKDAREKDRLAREKASLLKAQLAVELKIKSKREAWSNDKMLKKRWGFPRKQLQNTYTRYNYYFNANRKMEEAKENMGRIVKNNYDEPLPLYSFDPNRDSTILKSDMDSIVRKTSLGIQIHDPRSKWNDDLYLLMGEAYYYKGDYKNAKACFQHIVASREEQRKAELKKEAQKGNYSSRNKEAPSLVEPDPKGLLGFIKHDPAQNEALLWLARTYTSSGELDNAETIMDLVSNAPTLPDDLAGRVAMEKAFLAMSRSNTRTAREQLAIAAASGNLTKENRRRAAYLNGQLLEQAQDYKAAAAQYALVQDLNPSLEMDFNARRAEANNLLLAGEGQEKALASLKKMVNDNKYLAYHEQVYFVLGQLAASNNQNADAIRYLTKSVESSKTTKKQKALSFAALGNVYYTEANYPAAQNAYDSVNALSGANKGDSTVAMALRRGKVLDKIRKPAATIRSQDSLLALGNLSIKDQRNAVNTYLEMLRKQRADSIYKAQNAPIANAAENTAGNDPASAGWYFTNTAQMQQGELDFKRKWGNRPLVDNWRHASAIGGAGTGSNATAAESATIDALDENGFPTEESLLAAIPASTSDRNAAMDKIQRAYVDLGSAYLAEMDDYTKAGTVLDTLDSRYNVHPYTAEELYRRYQISLKGNDLTKAQGYSTQILQRYGNTKWAGLVRPSDAGSGPLLAANGNSLAGYYDETYNRLIQRDYLDVLDRVEKARPQTEGNAFKNKFLVMEAMALAGRENYDAADTLISGFLQEQPADSLHDWALRVKEYIAKNRPPAPPSTTIKDSTSLLLPAGQPVNTSLRAPSPAPAGAANAARATQLPVVAPGSATTDSAASTPNTAVPEAGPTVAETAPATYTYKPADEHYFAFSFGKMESRAMGVKAAMTDFNHLKFSGKELDNNVEMLKINEGMILSGKFKNAAEAKTYLATFRSTPQMTREYKSNEYELIVISAKNLLKLKADKDLKAYLNFYRSKY